MRPIHKFLIVCIFGIVLSLLYFYPIIFSKGQFGIQDWDQNFAWNEFTRISILKYKQFPFWNPYRCGGLPQFGNPEIGVVSFETLFVLLLGTIAGIKTSIILYVFMGFIGFYLYARQRLGCFSSILSAVIYAFSGITASFLSTGMVVFIVFAFIPYILLLYEKGMLNWKALFLSSLLFALSFYNGYHITLLLGIYLLCYSVVLSIFSKSIKPFMRFVLFGLLSTVFILPRLFLSVEFMQINPIKPFDHSGYTIVQFVKSLLSPFQDLYHDAGIPRYSWKVDETALYIGAPAFLLFCFGVFTQKWERKKVTMLSMFILMLLFAGGYQSIIPLYVWIKNISFFEPFRVAQRFRFLLIIPLSLLVGYGLEQLKGYAPPKKKQIFSVLTILLVVVDLVYFAHSNYFYKIFIYNIPTSQPLKEFAQVRIANYNPKLIDGLIPKEYEDTEVFSMWSYEYPTILENRGVINCSDTVTKIRKAAGFDKKGYRGEWYLQGGGGRVNFIRWTPHEIELKVSLKAEGDILILNENYYPGWYAQIDGGAFQEVKSSSGLISIPLKKDNVKIIFKYDPYKDIIKRFLTRFNKA